MAKLSEIRETYSTQKDLEEQGAWMTVAGGARFLVRSQQSKTARQYAQRAIKKHRHIYANGDTPSVEQQDEMDIDLCANVLIVGWDTLEDDDGKNLPYAKEKSRELMTTLPQLRRQVLLFSTDAASYRGAIEGNSGPSSKQS